MILKNQCWLLCDKYTLADDNCEHFYRFLRDYHPEIEIYYLLDSKSKDYERLKKEGFNIVSKNTSLFEHIFYKSNLLISSQLWKSVCKEHIKEADNKIIVFIPHGITLGDSSRYFNSYKFDLCTSCIQEEYNNYTNGMFNYKAPKHVFKLTGMPRHDYLLKKIDTNNYNRENRVISFVFTWRDINFKSPQYKTLFKNSNYVKTLNKLFNCEYFKELHNKYNIDFKIKFHPHIIHKDLEDCFNLPDFIKNCKNESYQDFLISTDILISDYSSACQEFATIGRNILYYQFDRDKFLSKESGHSYDVGWFDWDDESLGKICITEEDLCNSIDSIIENNFNVDNIYVERMKKFFKFHDTNNCKRVFDEISNVINEKQNQKNQNIEKILRLRKDIEAGKIIKVPIGEGKFVWKRIKK